MGGLKLTPSVVSFPPYLLSMLLLKISYLTFLTFVIDCSIRNITHRNDNKNESANRVRFAGMDFE